MAAASPSPNSPPLTIPPAPVSTRTPPPPQASSPPPTPPTSSPSSQPNANANPPETTNSTASSPLTPPSPPPTTPLLPPPQPPVVSPPQSAPPTSPPSNPRSPPPTTLSGVPPTSTSGSSPPPETSPPPPAPSSTPPMGSPPPPSFFPPFNSPPPPSPTPPKSSPPPPLAESPQTPPPPPPPSTSPESPPPPPAFPPPQSPSPPPPPRSFPPISSPPPTPPFIFPRRSPPPPALPPRNAPPPPAPGSNPTPPPANPPPSSPIRKHPPPSSPMPHPPHSRVPISPPDGATLNDTVPNLPGSAIIDDGGIGTGGVIAIGVVTGLIVLSLIGFVVWFIKKKNQNITGHGGHIVPSPQRTAPIAGPALKAHSPAPIFVGSPVEPGRLGNPISCFTFQVLYEATSGFSDQNLLAEGGSSSVYKGILSGGKEIAVKQLKTSGGQGEEEFKAEVEIVSRIHHRHLVSLVGYCISKNRRLLVFDYVPNNTLHYHLHGEGRPILNWATRLKVAIGAARGIAYLHEDCHPRVIHRDIKSSNILLDENFKARVSDFGLAKVAPDGQTHVSTGLAGTFGYVAPEYASSGKVTEKSDVYSYGVVLLELITGRKPLDTSQPLDDPSLVAWTRPLLRPALEKDELDGLVDPRLERNYVQKEMHTMIQIAAACVRHSSARRPRMGDVIKVFDDLAAVDINNGLKAGESEVVNAAQLKQLQRLAFGIQDYNTDIPSKGSTKRRNSRLKIG